MFEKSRAGSGKDNSRGTMDYSVRHARRLLRLLGVWALVGRPASLSNFEIIMGKIVRPIALFYSILALFPMFAEVIAQRAPRQELISLVAPLAYQTFNVIKFFFLLLRADAIKMSIQHMEIDWQNIDNDEDRAIMITHLQTANDFAILMTIMVYVGGSLHNLILPTLADPHLNELNETVRVLCFPGGDIFFNVQAKGVYELVSVTYWISDMFVVTISMSLFTLALILVRHTCGQIQIVVSKLSNLAHRERELPLLMDKPSGVAFIIRSHVRLLKFSIEIKDILKEIIAMEVMCNTLILCFLGYVSITDFDQSDHLEIFTYGMLIFVITFTIFVYCEIGEILKEQCQSVGETAYMIDWYKLPAKTSLAMIMIMNVSSARPRQLTAGGIMEMSRITFASIMKTSFAYLNMLRSVA
ncbi:uncharacterized protein [Venturia canescens]|uniref:uncharacterized protein n=1 Tax=Venturia canescens TaxID=32260 RepID=UPI001C9C0EEB|nr:uncharacterized protein LOC122414743 [Venturia canescens]